MKRIAILILISSMLPSTFVILSRAEIPVSENIQTETGVVFRLLCRAFQPGEIVRVVMSKDPPVKNAFIRFLGNEYFLSTSGEKWEEQAVIGLDLGLEPGSYPMKIYVENLNGKWEVINKDIPVLVRKFPVKKLWVEERYVTPPPSVRERIKGEAEVLNMVYSLVTPHWLASGNFILPCEGEVFQNFGERRIYNNKPRSSHSGVDISAPQGEPVKASNSGYVVLASDLYFSGNTVIIDHGLGLFSLYCHLSKIKVRRGQLVMKGKVIGEVGATGRVTGPHLHWGINLQGARVDPFSLLTLNFE